MTPLALVLFSPVDAFLAVRARARPWLLAAVVVLGAAVPGLTFALRADPDRIVQQLTAGKLPDDAPVDREKLAQGLKVVLPVGGAAKRAGMLLLVTGLATLLLRARREPPGFALVAATVAVGASPLVVEDCARTLLFLLRDPLSLDADNPLMTNVAAVFALDTKASALGAALRAVDAVRAFWLWLTALGLSVVSGARLGATAVPPLVIYGVVVAASVAGAAFR